MSNVTEVKSTLSIREQAELEVRKEISEKAKKDMIALIRQRASAEQVLAGIDRQIEDLERRISDGTY